MKHEKLACICIAILPALCTYGQKSESSANNAKDVAYRNTIIDNSGTINMKGAYHMDRHLITRGTHDTVLHTTQLKLYTNNYFIYVRPHESDSLAEYGIGTYSVTGGHVMEYPFYTSAGGARLDSFQLLVNRKTNGYSQIMNITDPRTGDLLVTEDYTNVSKPLRTPLDGAWKETQVTTITKGGKKTVDAHPVQFKVYESGHFIWVNTVTTNGTQHPISKYGYGTFTMKGRNATQETNTASTYYTSLVGKPVPIRIRWIGSNNYEQTIRQDNGDLSIETYERLH